MWPWAKAGPGLTCLIPNPKSLSICYSSLESLKFTTHENGSAYSSTVSTRHLIQFFALGTVRYPQVDLVTLDSWILKVNLVDVFMYGGREDGDCRHENAWRPRGGCNWRPHCLLGEWLEVYQVTVWMGMGLLISFPSRIKNLSNLLTQLHLDIISHSSSEPSPSWVIQYLTSGWKDIQQKKVGSSHQTIQCPRVHSDFLLSMVFLHFEQVCSLNRLQIFHILS